MKVSEFIQELQKYPPDFEVYIDYSGRGSPTFRHREMRGDSVVAIYEGSLVSPPGEAPFTEDEYKKKSSEFLSYLSSGYVYTSIHGSHTLYMPTGHRDDSCYGIKYDIRVVERMVKEGLIKINGQDIDRVRYWNR